MTTEINYNGRVFAPADEDVPSLVRGRFSQRGNLVRSDISGGRVLRGSMVGVCGPDGDIDAVYSMALADGQLVAGKCHYVPTVLPDGRLRLAEHYRRMDGTEGVSYIEEVPGPDERPHLLVIATGARLFREYLLRSISQQYRIHMFLGAEATWEREYIDDWTVLESTLDAPAMVAAAKELHGRDPVDGALCWDEARVHHTAFVAEALGLPGGDPKMIERCRDKHLTRQALSAAGVPQPQSILVDTVEEALTAAEKIGYPIILKPRALAASLGVIKVNGPDELTANWAFAHDTTVPEAPHYETKVLVEEFADGYEISIDSAVYHGDVQPFCLARKQLGYFPYAEEVGHVVDAGDPLWDDEGLQKMLRDTHAALGFTDGVTHTEIMMTSTGPKLIEVNARIGGDLIPYLGMRANGVDPGLAAAAVACGRAPDVTPDRSLVGSVRFFYVDEDDTTLTSIRFTEEHPHPATDLLVPLMQPGAVTSPPPKGTLWGRIAYATAVGQSIEECEAALDAAEAALRWNEEIAA